jgi:hypothetical protein
LLWIESVTAWRYMRGERATSTRVTDRSVPIPARMMGLSDGRWAEGCKKPGQMGPGRREVPGTITSDVPRPSVFYTVPRAGSEHVNPMPAPVRPSATGPAGPRFRALLGRVFLVSRVHTCTSVPSVSGTCGDVLATCLESQLIKSGSRSLAAKAAKLRSVATGACCHRGSADGRGDDPTASTLGP